MKVRHSDLETFLLIAIGWIGLLAVVFELFSVINPSNQMINEYGNITLSFGQGYDIKASTPPITVSEYNHFIILSSMPLFVLGLYLSIKNNYSKTYIFFLFLQAVYFLCQVLGFMMAGLYPIPAALMALLAGGALYCFGQCLLTRCHN